MCFTLSAAVFLAASQLSSNHHCLQQRTPPANVDCKSTIEDFNCITALDFFLIWNCTYLLENRSKIKLLCWKSKSYAFRFPDRLFTFWSERLREFDVDSSDRNFVNKRAQLFSWGSCAQYSVKFSDKSVFKQQLNSEISVPDFVSCQKIWFLR